ncbi:MAG: beta-glucosidase BglX [Bacteroidales bacterium]|nr:beta-glucosidase BglX [Bacteroidales bacterium]
MKKLIHPILLFITLILSACSSREKEMDRFVKELMAHMTVEEKIGQLNLPVTGEIVTGQLKSSDVSNRVRAGEVGGLFNLKGTENIRAIQRIAVEESRLGIPLLIGMDVIHGYETVFPIPLGLSCSWDMEAVEIMAEISGIEAGSDGIAWTFSPMVDVSRDPRWGRVSEGAGEDPYLVSQFAKAMVRGYQNAGILPCVKHFALYGAAEGGRDYNTVDMSRGRMYNVYLPPFKAAVEEGAGSFMASFNEIDGVPATANKWLLTDVLRKQWGFEGFVVSDYTGILEMVDHGIGNIEEVSYRALNAGLDMDMVSEAFSSNIKRGLEKGQISPKRLDEACRKILEAKYRLGLFDDPYKFCRRNPETPDSIIYSQAHRKEARRIASESFVLLKNESILPLKKTGTIAVIGPLADTRENMAGTWSVAARLGECRSVLDGIRSATEGKAKVLYAKGSNLVADEQLEQRATTFGRAIPRDGRSDQELLLEAVSIASRADVIVAALGEASEMSGESSSRSDISIPDVQVKLLEELLKCGKPLVLVLFNGRPLTMEKEVALVPALLDVWFGGSESGDAIADVLFGDVNPSGKLTMTFPKNVGQIPIYYSHKNTGRPLGEGQWFQKFRSNYLDVDNDPLFPFGFGLSYTRFEYGSVQLSTNNLSQNESLEASVVLSNTGDYDGKEIVQLYVRDLVGSVTRPVKELKGFQKVFLKAGESTTVSFHLNASELGFYKANGTYFVEPGEFELFIGPSSTTVNSAKFLLN